MSSTASDTSADVILLQTAMDAYRQAFVDAVLASDQTSVEIWVGDDFFTPTVVTRIRPHRSVRRLKNVYIFRRRASLQVGPFLRALKVRVLVLELNPRVITNWFLLLIRRLAGKRTLAWGHAWPRQGSDSATDHVRALMRRLASEVLVYTKSEAEQLAQSSPNIFVTPVTNAIAPAAEIGCLPFQGSNILYSGRLVPAKKPDLLLRAFSLAINAVPPDTQLVYVGDGPMRSELEALASTLGIDDRVEFVGHCVDSRLREHYSECVVSASPGYAGLALIQSLGYGRPMIIADKEPHAPEIEAARPGVNCVYFEAGSERSLARALQEFFETRHTWAQRCADISRQCECEYSTESMAEQFLRAVAK